MEGMGVGGGREGEDEGREGGGGRNGVGVMVGEEVGNRREGLSWGRSRCVGTRMEGG